MKYLVVRVRNTAGGMVEVQRSTEWYPRVVEADNPAEAVELMYEQPRFAGSRTFLALPINAGEFIEVRPRREYETVMLAPPEVKTTR